MSKPKKAVFNWSGGKDSALALCKVLQEKNFEVVSLLTTFDEATLTSSIHSVPLKLLQIQADCIGFPLYTVLLSKDKKTYEAEMTKAVNHFKNQGVKHFIFGDIFLEDILKYRENRLNPLGIEVVEPLWGKSSKSLMNEFLNSGIQSKIIVTQANKLDDSFIGKTIDRRLVNSFPKDIDVCGENGEYHSFAYAGSLFKKKIDFEVTKAKLITHEFKMDNGKVEKFNYWQAEIKF